ncbi:MAG: hypothetical protein Q9165_006859 [Trypethelium subeluteriae]
MFAVPGWSVNAANLKQQTEPVKEVSEHKKSKKRKRGSNGPAVTPENVGSLWEQHFGGKDPKNQESNNKRRESKERKEKRKQGPSASEQNANAGIQTPGSQSTSTSTIPAATGFNLPKDRAEKKSQKQRRPSTDAGNVSQSTVSLPKKHEYTVTASTSLPPSNKLTPLQNSMRQKLIAARFRHLNETLYTKPSSHSLELFSKSPEMFEEYHKGFRQQVAVWPENPVDTFVKTIQERGSVGLPTTARSNKKAKPRSSHPRKGHNGQTNPPIEPPPGTSPLPRTNGFCTLADLGCGDAALASTLQRLLAPLHLRIHSFDLHAHSPLITRADIAALPLPPNSVDVGIFCLALMGTNWLDFIDEAWRVLRWKGELWVAEIKSRFGRVEKRREGRGEGPEVGRKGKKGNGKGKGKGIEGAGVEREEESVERELAVEVDGVAKPAETDVSDFVEVLKRRGFVLREGEGVRAVDLSNKMFVRMEFVKGATPSRGKNVPERDEGKEGGGDARTFKNKPKRKFLGNTEEVVDAEVEANVLKPCMYKLR